MRAGKLAMTAAALTLLTTGTAAAVAAGGEVIEPVVTGPVLPFSGSVAQSFSPTTTGVVSEITVWSQRAAAGDAASLVVHAGDRPGDEISRTSFVWVDNPTAVTLDVPVAVAAGEVYALQLTGVVPEVIFGWEDPYPGGEFAFVTAMGWTSWTEYVGQCQGCRMPFVADQRFSLEVVPNDADGDGVLDTDDLCDDTVLPDPSIDALRSNRYAATADGIVGVDGAVIATLAETGGCSAAQIVAAYCLGAGHLRFGLTRPHVERWIADATAG